MSIVQENYGESGASIEPFALMYRAQASGYLQGYFGQKYINQYRYVRLLTSAEAASYGLDSSLVTETSATLSINSGGTTGISISTTTAVDLSQYTLDETKQISITKTWTGTAWKAIAVLFYN